MVLLVLLVQVQNLWRFFGFCLLHFLTVILWEREWRNKQSNYLQKMFVFVSCGHQVAKIHKMTWKNRKRPKRKALTSADCTSLNKMIPSCNRSLAVVVRISLPLSGPVFMWSLASGLNSRSERPTDLNSTPVTTYANAQMRHFPMKKTKNKYQLSASCPLTTGGSKVQNHG